MSQTLQTDGIGPILGSLLEVQDANVALVEGDLGFAASEIAKAADEVGVQNLWGSSLIGQVLTGAALAGADHLHLWRPGVEASILLVEGSVVGMMGLELAAAQARAAGASDVHAFVTDLPQIDAAVQGIGRIFGLERTALAA